MANFNKDAETLGQYSFFENYFSEITYTPLIYNL